MQMQFLTYWHAASHGKCTGKEFHCKRFQVENMPKKNFVLGSML